MKSVKGLAGRPQLATAAFGLLLTVLAAGCDRSGLDLAPVEGIVTQNGAPVEGAGVLFLPQTGPFAMGTTDAEGRFTLKTANYPGALVGEHRVTISKTQTTATKIPGQLFPRYDTKYEIPQKYCDASTSGLVAKVIDDDNKFEFDVN
jgi:hypothetical protein